MVHTSSKKRRRESSSSDDSESGREYQVEAILDKRIRGKKTQYFLKWKGYSSADNTWEDETRLNCPDLVEDFEERLKAETNGRKSAPKTKKQSPTKKTKNTDRQSTDEDYESDESQSVITENGTASITNDDVDVDDDDSRMATRQSPRKKASVSKKPSTPSRSARRHSNRNIVKQTKSRISSMSKNDSSDDESDDVVEEDMSSTKTSRKNQPKNRRSSDTRQTITIEDDDNNAELPDKNLSKEDDLPEPTTVNLRLCVTPRSTSSASLTLNENDNNNNNSEKTSTENNLNNEEITDETDQVEKIECVRNKHGEISFKIKLFNGKEPQWISSKIANRKYSQAVIAFWENHVEFT